MQRKTIVAIGYHDQQSPRHWSVCQALRKEGYDILECHTTARGFFGKCADLWKTFHQLKAKSSQLKAILVTFPGHYLVPLAWILTRFSRRKLIFDAFISLYDTNVFDRKRVPRWHPHTWLWYIIDFVSCHLADEILIDTEEHKKYFVCAFRLHPKKIRVIYLETRPDLFFPKPTTYQSERLGRAGNLQPTTSYKVLFYGSFIPLHGIEYILQAAKILQDSSAPVHITLLGKGQTLPATEKLADVLHLTNVTFLPPVPLEELPSRIRSSDLCLGIFGTSAKVQRVIPHKVLDAVACGVPVITADTPAIRERFADHPLVHLVPAGNAEQLADRIRQIVHSYGTESLESQSDTASEFVGQARAIRSHS